MTTTINNISHFASDTEDERELVVGSDAESDKGKELVVKKAKSKNELIVKELRSLFPFKEYDSEWSGTNYQKIIKSMKECLSEMDPEFQEKFRELVPDGKKKGDSEGEVLEKPKVKRAPRAVAKAELYDGDSEEFEDLKYLGEVEGLTTEMLFEKFGTPMDNPDTCEETMDWRYEYRIKVGKKLYCIYDKLNWDDTWDSDDCIEWYANGDGALKTLVAGLGV